MYCIAVFVRVGTWVSLQKKGTESWSAECTSYGELGVKLCLVFPMKVMCFNAFPDCSKWMVSHFSV